MIARCLAPVRSLTSPHLRSEPKFGASTVVRGQAKTAEEGLKRKPHDDNAMCKKITKLYPFVAFSFILLGFSWAGQQVTDSELISKLEEMQSKHDWQARNRTGAPKLFLLMHQARVSRLLNQLKSGNTIDPRDIDVLYREHYRGVPGRVE